MKTTAVEVPQPKVTGCTIKLTRYEALVLLSVSGSIAGLRSGPRGVTDTLAEQLREAFSVDYGEARGELGISSSGFITMNDKETA